MPACSLHFKLVANTQKKMAFVSEPDGGWTEVFPWFKPWHCQRQDFLCVWEKPSCFSCGCGCCAQEDVCAVCGRGFFNVSGFPIPSIRKGLYELKVEKEGRTNWRHVIKGRIEPALAFSPSGCLVSFYHVSHWSNSLDEEKLCLWVNNLETSTAANSTHYWVL
jgi:hypothetical protein